MNGSYLESCAAPDCTSCAGPGGRAATGAGFCPLNRLKSAIPSTVLYSMPKAAAPSPVTDASSVAMPATYEAAMGELETLVARLESGEMPLDQLLTGYQRGAALLQFCRDRLQAVEDQIKVLDDGVLKPWKAQ